MSFRPAQSHSLLGLTVRYTIIAAVTPLGAPNAVAISHDQGSTWRATTLAGGVRIDTFDVVPGHPDRIYLSGSIAGAPLLLRSDDGGATFAEATRNFLGGFAAYITAVERARPDVVYVRSNLPSGGTFSRAASTAARLSSNSRTRRR